MKKDQDDMAFMSNRERLEAKAQAGSVMAMNMLEKMDLEEKLEEKKRELMEGAMYGRPDNRVDELEEIPVLPTERSVPELLKDLDISEIESYIRTGEAKALPEHMAVYLRWMQMAHDWYYKFKDKNWIVKYLMANCKDADGRAISVYLANKIFTDMLSFFYSDADFKRNSWFLYLAERVVMGASLAWEMNDMKTYTDALDKAAGILARITIEKQAVDPRLLKRRPRFFMTDAKQLGLPAIDRNALAKGIDEMVIPEKVKIRAKQDLGVIKRDLSEDILGEEIEETK